MTGINIFESPVKMDIEIHKGSLITVSNGGRILCEGIRDYCMGKIRQMVYDLSDLGIKVIVFNIKKPNLDANPLFDDDKAYFKDHLYLLGTSCKCRIDVMAGLYNLLA